MSDDQYWVRAAVSEGALVGVATWRPIRDEETSAGAPVADLEMLFVAPEAWRHGVGARLLAAAEASMRERGCRAARLKVAELNPARDFYERHGWSEAGPPRYEPRLDLRLVPYERRLGTQRRP
jgi:GNAT superfamily N-acetyltransferase